MRSGSFERGDQPRSVSDPDRDAYEKMIRSHAARAAGHDRGSNSPITATTHARSDIGPQPHSAFDHVAAGIAHVLNEPREARRQFEQHHYGRALLDTVTAAADLTLLRSVGKGLWNREFKLLPPYSWKAPPRRSPGARKWMTEKGIAAKGQDVHHGIIPNGRWGKHVPDAIKNQPFNARPLDEKLTHIRIHGNSRKTGLPRFNPVERYLHGAPTWWKAAHASAAGHTAQAVGSRTLAAHSTHRAR